MKHLCAIGFAVLLAFATCTSKVKVVEPAETPTPELSLIDSLLWHQPDSALACLLPYFDTCCRDAKFCVSTATEYNRHYAHLLLAELLYKNDYAQTNREELLQAISYFDSLVRPTPPFKGAGGIKKDLNPNLVFLDARAHYMNGVGYYEQDSMVPSCEEYLKALEMMEEHFEEEELVGHKARFMAYTYNRLGEVFSEQLLADPAIVCFKQALFYCKIEPTSIYGIPLSFYNLGIQYDIANQKDSASFYYDKALANMPDFDNLHYRDLMANKTVFAFYNLDYSSDSIINSLKQLVTLSADEKEKTTRLLTLGNILFEYKQYDSSLMYLETVFEQQDDVTSRIMAAEKLSIIYQMDGDSIKAQRFKSLLAGYTMTEINKKTDVSKINEMFKDYLTKKQTEIDRKKTVKKTIKVIIPIVVVLALIIIVLAKFKSKKLLKEQQEESGRVLGETKQQFKEELRLRQAEAKKTLEEKDKQHAEAIEAERQTHRMEQAAISGRLKRKNQEVRELKDQIRLLDDLALKTETASSFNDEPICHLIMERVHDGQFKSKIDCDIYKQYALDKQQILDLRMATDRHYDHFTLRLKKAYPKLTSIDIDYCCLYLLGLTHADISALMQRAYNTVVERDSKIQKIIGTEKPLSVILIDLALNTSSI